MTTLTDPRTWPDRPPLSPPEQGPGTAPAAPPAAPPPAPLPPGFLGGGSVADPPGPTGPTPSRSAWKAALAGMLAVLGVLALVGGAVALVRARDGDDTASSTTTRAPRATTTTPEETDPSAPSPGEREPDPEEPTTGGFTSDPEALREEIAELRHFVEEKRGLTFERDVTVTVMEPEAFKAEVEKEYLTEAEEIREEGEVLRGSGLIPGGYDVVGGQIKLARDSVLGFYDPETERLVVRGGGRFTPFLRRILVHELVHALDDQRLKLDRPELEDAPDERWWSFLAVVEGSARRVELAYVEQLSEGDTQLMEQEQFKLGMEQQGALLGVPLVLAQMQSTPYVHGEPFVTALVEQGGTAALDEALRNPPTTSEQVLDPAKYRAREAPVAVPAPPADGAVVREGTLGELDSAFLMQGAETNRLWDRLAKGQITPDDLAKLQGLLTQSGELRPITTVKGWGGDRFVVWRPTNGGVCLRVDWRMDSPDARSDMRLALQAWAQTDPAVQIAEPNGELLRATRCG